MTLVSQAKAYEGRADHAWPPCEGGWAEVPVDHDAIVVERAKGLLGALPVYHYTDEVLSSGLYRFFAFETPIGHQVSALKFVGPEREAQLMMGLPPSNLLGFTPVSYANTTQAAKAMNNALIARGYIQSDQSIYAGFQQSHGMNADGFPGRDTMDQLAADLLALGIPMTSAKVYPWLAETSDGKTGTSAYDGSNAPLWSAWTGSGTGPAPAKGSTTGGAAVSTASMTGTALGVVGLLALVGAAIFVKSSSTSMYPG
jgi:hypothetical protein